MRAIATRLDQDRLVESTLILGIILIKAQPNHFIIVIMILDAPVQTATNAAFIKDIWKALATVVLWSKIKFTLETIGTMDTMPLCSLLAASQKKPICFTTKQPMAS